MPRRAAVPAREGLDREITEADFQRTVVELAQYHRWRVYHSRAAVDRSGRWSTPMTGTPGFPDLVLARMVDRRLVFAELKRETGRTSAQQGEWLEVLTAVAHRGQAVAEYPVMLEVYVWRPSDWPEIERILT